MPKLDRSLIFSLLFPILFAHTAYAQAPASSNLRPADACLAFTGGLSLGAGLPRTSERLKSNKSLTIVTLGSSSTTGFGTLTAGVAFPDVMQQELSRLWPAAQIELINRGRILDTIPGNLGRLQTDVLRHNPDLLVWQLGTNDVVWFGLAEHTKRMIVSGVRQLKADNVDIVLMDLQYVPMVRVWPRHSEMQRIIADVAREERVGLFPRFLLMKRAIDAGVRGIVAWDGLHKSAEGYKCVGRALGRMIDAAVRN